MQWRNAVNRHIVVRVVVLVVPVVLAMVLARPLVGAPVNTLAAIIGVAVVVLLLARVELAVLLFVAVEPFEDYVRSLSGSAVKGLGLVLVAAWLIRIASPNREDGLPLPRDRRTRPRGTGLAHPVALSGVALVAVVLAATVMHSNGSDGTETLTRYLSFLGALIVIIDTLYRGLSVAVVARVFVTSCTVAAAVGLVNFFGGATRVTGPLTDPNDFAFFMVAALPLALVLRRLSRRPILWDLAAVLIGAAMAATLSRGALLAVVAMLTYAVVAGVVRARVVGGMVAGVIVIGAVVAIANPTLLNTSLHEKSFVATQNVDDRLKRWTVAAEMTADYPLLGTGPGGFKTNYERYVAGDLSNLTHQLDVAHETYLEVSSELGLLGLAAFLGVLGSGFAGAYRRTKRPDADQWLAGGVCASLIGAVVAAAFLTEQYYLPLWLLAALGAAMDPRYRGDPVADTDLALARADGRKQG